ncbi:hypothetical protein [Effusibacillus lacus]|uniref:Uncharacterized protein n=1 Tax=Effusibacillus lacus TaxID=1348429 RepID=A0A292YI02_9BACL|nr:hypothetical protein [Effusibacillus lacus]TCS74564.1 hypothetical protein EDD64_11212 [Effusibacillus lacus]GAX88439.1 hypothetical protein EFBL_0048 [Effusibacillus lacus]
MLWEEVRQLYPNQFVLVQALKSRVEENKKYVEEVAVIRPIPDEQEATRVLVRSKGDTFVYHTSKPEIAMPIVIKPIYRGYNPQ